MKSTLPLLVVLGLLAGPGPLAAQTVETARRTDIEHLLEYGFASADIIAWLGEKDRRIELDAADLETLAGAGADESLLGWLRARLPETSVKKLAVEDVIALWKKEGDQGKLLATVLEIDRDWLLEPGQVLALTRAEVPKAVIEAMRGRRPAAARGEAAGERLSLDDVVRMTADGLTKEAIIARIEASPSRYEVDAERILELKRDGVALEVLQALYRRRVEKAAPVVETPTSASAPAAPKPAEASEAAYEILEDRGSGFSMLRPTGWVVSQEFKSTKSLIQIVEPTGADEKGLPDLEMSIMVVHPKRRPESEPSPAQLEAIARSFIETLTGQFARDGIELVADRPQRTWISARPALAITTNARVAATNRSYRGVFYVLQAQEKIWVLSSSCRLERSAAWLTRLEDCLRSFNLTELRPTEPVLEGSDRREQVVALFEAWRRSLRRLDYDSFRRIHDSLPDDVDVRRRFLSLAASLNDEGKRIEIDGIDFDRSLISYNLWGLDGQSRSSLLFLRRGEGYRLASKSP